MTSTLTKLQGSLKPSWEIIMLVAPETTILSTNSLVVIRTTKLPHSTRCIKPVFCNMTKTALKEVSCLFNKISLTPTRIEIRRKRTREHQVLIWSRIHLIWTLIVEDLVSSQINNYREASKIDSREIRFLSGVMVLMAAPNLSTTTCSPDKTLKNQLKALRAATVD